MKCKGLYNFMPFNTERIILTMLPQVSNSTEYSIDVVWVCLDYGTEICQWNNIIQIHN